MKVLVCISKTPDTTSKIAFKDGNTKFDETGVQWIINPYDEWYSLVRAIELKEKDATVKSGFAGSQARTSNQHQCARQSRRTLRSGRRPKRSERRCHGRRGR